ncbi:MAG: SAM-dependent methyltransferase [Idiomarina sp.]|nr:SAM-dependent methyltransferase [Idiomarina sp.]
MTAKPARAVTSNQPEVHDDLLQTVRRYQQHAFLKPIADHSKVAFDQAQAQLERWQGPLVLDSCCGVGESTAVLAGRYPEALVIGVDKSAHRLGRNMQHKQLANGREYLLLRADLNDFWRLAAAAQWQPQAHYLLYPNPYPKQKHLVRRWHGSPVFPSFIALGGKVTVRSNWELYIREFALALSAYEKTAQVAALAPQEQPITPFERKYQAAGQSLWELTASLS